MSQLQTSLLLLFLMGLCKPLFLFTDSCLLSFDSQRSSASPRLEEEEDFFFFSFLFLLVSGGFPDCHSDFKCHVSKAASSCCGRFFPYNDRGRLGSQTHTKMKHAISMCSLYSSSRIPLSWDHQDSNTFSPWERQFLSTAAGESSFHLPNNCRTHPISLAPLPQKAGLQPCGTSPVGSEMATPHFRECGMLDSGLSRAKRKMAEWQSIRLCLKNFKLLWGLLTE